jgi:hypothetical protein
MVLKYNTNRVSKCASVAGKTVAFTAFTNRIYYLYSIFSELAMTSPLVTIHLEAEHFPYTCDRCNAPVCERQTLLALALGIEEETLCIACLEASEGLLRGVFLPKTKRYIHSRTCFKKPWDACLPQAQTCPLHASGQCPCQD